MESKDRQLRSHQSVMHPCPKPDKSNHALSSYFFKIHFNITLPPMPMSSKWPLSCRFHSQHTVYNFLLPCLCHISNPPHSPILLPRWGTWNMKLLFMKFSLVPCYFLHIKFKYLSQHPIFTHFSSFPSWIFETEFHTHIKYKVKL